MSPEKIQKLAEQVKEADARIAQNESRKNAAFFELLSLLSLLEAGEKRIPDMAFAMYPELRDLKAQAKTAREAVDLWTKG